MSLNAETKLNARSFSSDFTDDDITEFTTFFSFFGEVVDPNQDARRLALKHACNALKLSALRLVTTQANSDLQDSKAADCYELTQELELTLPESRLEAVIKLGGDLVKVHTASITRLAYESPLDDVRESFSELMDFISEKLPQYVWPAVFSPSHFVKATDCVPISPKAPVTQQLLVDIFLSTGRVNHVERLLAWHPTFLKAHNDCINFAMRSNDAPLPICDRHFIAMLAASRYQCDYLISLQEKEFIWSGGDESWLRGLDHAPKKLAALAELNALLAHQPWTITQEHIRTLVQEHHWTTSELVHAIVILTTFHSLSGVVFALGVNPEVDTVTDDLDESTSDALLEVDEKAEDRRNTEQAVKLLRAKSPDQYSEADNTESFEQAGLKEDTKLDNTTSSVSPLSAPFSSLEDIKYKNFDVKSTFYSVFRTNEYSWKEHGYSLVQEFFPGIGPLLDAEFDTIFNLTYNTFSTEKNVDTGPFRKAIWFYVQRLYGVCYDDYNYQDVNEFLNREIKSYAKKAACHPKSVSVKDFRSCGYEFKLAEKAHVALLSVIAKKVSSLLYGLHVIMEHQQ